MSVNNTEALANQNAGGSGEFSSRVAPSEPLLTSGHQPGKQVGNDAVPEFHAETLPAGTAPPSRTFEPNTDATLNTTSNKASDTIIGTTSGDVHTGLGHPGQGQSSAELRHDGQAHRKNPGQSLEGTGASGAAQQNIQ